MCCGGGRLKSFAVCCGGGQVEVLRGVLWRGQVEVLRGVLWRGQIEVLRGVLWRGQFQDRADQFSCPRLSPSTKLFGDSLDSPISIEAMGFHPNVASVMHR